jgi:hypothetical protein
LGAKVIRLRAALRADLEVAVEAFEAGDYRRALGFIEGIGGPFAGTLRLRMLRRLRAFGEAAAGLAGIDPGSLDRSAPPAATAIYCALGGQALAAAGEAAEARAWATFARVYAAIAGDGATDAELACIFAAPAFPNGEPLGLGDTVQARRLGDARLLAIAHETDALRAAAAERFPAAIEQLRAALDANEACAQPDRWLAAGAIAQGAAWAAARDDRTALAFFGSRFDGFEWVEQLAAFRSAAAYHLGAGHAAAHNLVAAFRYLREAERSGAPRPDRIALLTLRAEIAAELGETSVSLSARRRALGLALDSPGWQATPPEDRIALLALAAATAPADLPAAQRLCRLAETAGVRTLNDQATAARDPADRAIASLALGRVAASAGEPDRARQRLVEAFAAFTALAHPAAAALCAGELHRLDVVTKDVVDAIETAERRFAHSWIARRLRRLTSRP